MTNAEKDRQTLEAIGFIYCRAHHLDEPKDAQGLCPSCREAIEGTLLKTLQCPYNHAGNCQDCTIHCQRGESQARIKTIMAYAAPRMLLRHPVMTARYLGKKLRPSPSKKTT